MERLSQQHRVIKTCIDAGFLTTVEVGQYFMTKDTDEFLQFAESVACREYTLPRDEDHLTRKVGFKGTAQLDPCWKSQLVTSKVNMESVNKEKSHSWVRISHGLNKLVMDLSIKEDDDNEQETSEMQFEEFCV